MTSIVITKEKMQQLARSSHLFIEEHELEAVIKSVTEVLSYAAMLNDAISDTGNLVLYPHTQTCNVTRVDVSVVSNSDEILKCGPEVSSRLFVVPSIIKQ